MQLPYFYEPNVTATANALVILSEETSRHCIQVLRMREGERMQLVNGKGGLFIAAIAKADKKYCSVRVEEAGYQKPDLTHICVAVSLLKNAGRWEWFLEKAVEMGVTEIIPLLCERTETQQFKQERLQGIVVAAMLQSRQVWLPKLHMPTPFEDVVAGSNSFIQKGIAYCVEAAGKGELNQFFKHKKTQILIGPEGDFSDDEISLALQNGYRPVSLGSTRLRTETAGVVASALLIHLPK